LLPLARAGVFDGLSIGFRAAKSRIDLNPSPARGGPVGNLHMHIPAARVRTRTDAMINAAQRCDVLSDNIVRDLKRNHARPRRIKPNINSDFL
jgi:hypothetical protein